MYAHPRHRNLALVAGAVAVAAVLLAAIILAVVLHHPAAAEPSGPLPPAEPAPSQTGALLPAGQSGGWRIAFDDEFAGSTVDSHKWTDDSSAEPDGGHGNQPNMQLEWNRAANCTVSGGQLTMTAKRQALTAPSGTRYGWTSCLLTTTPSFAFRYGYLEERAILPAASGFWPAFWTWQAPDVDQQIETDVYELHTPRHSLLMTQHSGAGGECTWRPTADLTDSWHTYGVAILPTGTTWYVDGQQVCHTAATSTGSTNLITNLAVDGANPPDAGTTTAVKVVDYIRAWAPA